MGFDVDEEILQDFLVEAGEILEQLQEQLVELENNPQDSDLLNAIFRGYHTVKGGAGFLSLTELVDICHGAENVFDVMRNGQRSLTPELMDIILQATDEVVAMFEDVKSNKPLVAAEQSLLDTLHRLSKPETQDEVTAPPVIDTPIVEAPTEAVSQPKTDSDDFDESEFEALLDELHGKGGSPTATSAPTPPAPVAPQPVSDSGDITDDEFEKLLDELHGAGKSPTAAGSTPPPPAAPSPEPVSAMSEGDDLMTDEEFEKLLDQLHGSGNGPTLEELDAATKPAAVKPEPIAPAPQAAPKHQPSAPVAVKAAPAKTEVKAPAKKQQADATVRVDTSTLDTIMNMVGELVLVRNRLVSLGLNSNDEEMAKAVSNLDVVTADLQSAVMKTRMQPIKKVFDRFPRVVRDLARSLKKDIVLEMRGEETDLDKNLVEALADPLIHLVRNSVDHGIEMPEAVAHTAEGDVAVLKAVYERLVKELGDISIEEQIEISNRPILFKKIKFGKYAGNDLADIAVTNPQYLEWLLNQKKESAAKQDDTDWIYTLEHYLRNV